MITKYNLNIVSPLIHDINIILVCLIPCGYDLGMKKENNVVT